MLLSDAIKLIHDDSLIRKNSIWADLGCGSGLFSYALANIVIEESIIYAIDKSFSKLTDLPNPNQIPVIKVNSDFEKDDLQLKNLNGILMANSLHFVKDKESLLKNISKSLKSDGAFLFVEYDTQIANPWVPFPIQYEILSRLLEKTGFSSGIRLREMSSVFGPTKIYSALFRRP